MKILIVVLLRKTAVQPMHHDSDASPSCDHMDMADSSQMQRNLIIATLLTLPVVILSFFNMLAWVQFLLATPVVLWFGAPFFQKGLLYQKKLNMFSLISLGIGAAYFYSLFALLFHNFFPEVFIKDGK